MGVYRLTLGFYLCSDRSILASLHLNSSNPVVEAQVIMGVKPTGMTTVLGKKLEEGHGLSLKALCLWLPGVTGHCLTSLLSHGEFLWLDFW